MNLEILFLKTTLTKMIILSELASLANHQFQFYKLEELFPIKLTRSIDYGMSKLFALGLFR